MRCFQAPDLRALHTVNPCSAGPRAASQQLLTSKLVAGHAKHNKAPILESVVKLCQLDVLQIKSVIC